MISDDSNTFWKRWLLMNEVERPKHIAKLVPLLKQSLIHEALIPGSTEKLLNSYFQDLEKTVKTVNGGAKNGSTKRSTKQTKSKKSSIPRPKKRL